MLDKIISLLKKQKRTQKELCNFLGLNQVAFTDWKSGKSESYKKYLPQIAEFFGCSVDFLLENGQKKEAVRKDSQNDEENIDEEIMRLVEGMTLEQKQRVLLESYRLLRKQNQEDTASRNG